MYTIFDMAMVLGDILTVSADNSELLNVLLKI